MKDSSQVIGTRLIALVTVVGCVLAGLALYSRKAKDPGELARLQRDLSALKAEFDAQQERLSALESNSHISPPSGRGLTSMADLLGSGDENLAGWITESARIQSNTAALLERLMATLPQQASPQKIQAKYAMMEAEAHRHRQHLEDLRKEAADLLVSLQVPDEVAGLDPTVGLDIPGLRTYWPFFEAKRNRDQKEHYVRAFELKLLSQRTEL